MFDGDDETCWNSDQVHVGTVTVIEVTVYSSTSNHW